MSRRAYAAAVAILVLGQVAQVLWLWVDGFDAVSSDELFRSYQAHLWAESPSVFPPFLWPPFYYWVYGSAMATVPDALWTPRIVTLLLAAANTVLAARFLARISRDRVASIIVVATWALSPLFLRLASVALAETLTTTCLIIALDRFFAWEESKSRGAIAVSAVALACSALTRFEVWLLVAAFGVMLALRAADLRERLVRIAIAGIPVAAVATLMIHGAMTSGDPLVGFTAFVNHSATMNLDRMTVASEVVHSLAVGAPIIIALGLLWLTPLAGGPFAPKSIARAIAAVALTFPVSLAALGHLPTQFAARGAALPLTLMLPAAVLQLSKSISGVRWRTYVAGGSVALLAVVGFFQARENNPPFPDAIRAGKELRVLAGTGVIGAREVVFAEARDWDGLGIWAFSNLKARVQFDTEPRSTKPSLFFHPRPEKLGAELFSSGVRWVLVREPRFIERARRAFEVSETRAVAGYELMRVQGPGVAMPSEP